MKRYEMDAGTDAFRLQRLEKLVPCYTQLLQLQPHRVEVVGVTTFSRLRRGFYSFHLAERGIVCLPHLSPPLVAILDTLHLVQSHRRLQVGQVQLVARGNGIVKLEALFAEAIPRGSGYSVHP
ncbi:hypothetical protein ES703_02733 [subsurface metagenome]